MLNNTQSILHKVLQAMDSTHKWYTNEDEANRELTTSLLVLGYDAIYHYPLDYNRIADVFALNSIIEGKLKPNKADIDRLIGQTLSYLRTDFDIYIIIYGKIQNQELVRVQQLINEHPNRISLVYLDNPNRDRTIRTLETPAAVNTDNKAAETLTSEELRYLPHSDRIHKGIPCGICGSPDSYFRYGYDLCLNCIRNVLVGSRN